MEGSDGQGLDRLGSVSGYDGGPLVARFPMRRPLFVTAFVLATTASIPTARADVAPDPPSKPTGDVKCNGTAGGACTVAGEKGTCKEYKCTRGEAFACFYCTASTGEIIEAVADGTSVSNPDGSPAQIGKADAGGASSGGSSSGGCSAAPSATPWLLGALAVPALVLAARKKRRR